MKILSVTMNKRLRGLGLVCVSLGLLGCEGTRADDGSEPAPSPSGGASSIGGGSSGGAGSGGTASGSAASGGSESVVTDPEALAAACEERRGQLTLGLTKLRRMTRAQLDNTLFDLLGVTSHPAQALAPDEKIGPFDNNAITPVTDLLVEQHQEIAQSVASEVLPRREEITGCDLDAEGTACATAFIGSFGTRALRRPLSEEEEAAYLSLYQLGAEGDSPEHGFQLLIEAFLQSPSFLYHVDVPASGVATASAEPVDAFALASRLSYFLWNTMPDEELLAKASDGSLLSEAVVEEQVTRLLGDDRAAETIGLFHRQWLKVEGIEQKGKSETLYPGFSPEIAAAMSRELGRFSEQVIRSGDGLLSTLLTANYSFPETALLPFYGMQAPPGWTSGERLEISHPRAGVLTLPAVMTKLSHPDQTSPVHRGILMLENLLCQHVDPPPAGVNNAPPAVNGAMTTRERVEQHTASPVCAECHAKIDPLGMAFEHYDPVGAYRTEDGAAAVDARGSYVGTRSDLQGSFNDAVEMAAQLAQSSEVRDCVSTQWFRFALGRAESLDDACAILDMRAAFSASGANINTLFHLIAQSDAFQSVRSTAGE